MDLKLTDPQIVEGRKVFNVRQRVPFKFFSPVAEAEQERAEEAAQVESETTEDRARNSYIIEGIASSTSTDSHGTEMSLKALSAMAAQFKDGVVYLPTHKDSEWDQVMGKTTDAKIVKSDVLQPADMTEAQYVLKTTVKLYRDHPKTKDLIKRLKRGEVIGMSIGGWFTDMQIVTNDEEEVERIIIKDVELDHLATTRRPSNPDSYMTSFRSSLSDAITEYQKGADMNKAVETTETEDRHILAVTEYEDAIEVKYSKAMSEGDHDDQYSKTDSPVDQELDAEQSAEDTTPNNNGEQMNQEIQELKSTLQGVESKLSAMADAIKTLAERTETPAPEAQPEKVEEQVEVIEEANDLRSELNALREQLAASNAEIESLRQPIRRGIATPEEEPEATVNRGDDKIKSLPEGSAIKKVLAEQYERRSKTTRRTRQSLNVDLRNLIEAALVDGIMHNPDNNSASRHS